jgi:hypothetical protein
MIYHLIDPSLWWYYHFGKKGPVSAITLPLFFSIVSASDDALHGTKTEFSQDLMPFSIPDFYLLCRRKASAIPRGNSVFSVMTCNFSIPMISTTFNEKVAI